MKRILFLLLITLVVLFARQEEFKSEVSFYTSGVKSETNLDIGEQLSNELRFGLYVEDNFFNMLEFGFKKSSNISYSNSTEKTDINRLFLSIVKERYLTKDIALYGSAGIGHEEYTNSKFLNQDIAFVQYGIGTKLWIKRRFAIRIEVTHNANLFGDNNLLYSLGFVVPIQRKTPRDDDRDGVLNVNDRCPNTRPGKFVDKRGCLEGVPLNVNFSFDRSNYSEKYDPTIEDVAVYMKENEKYEINLDGHTDSKGSSRYNLALSVKRAFSIARELMKQGVVKDNIKINPYGETNPKATNKTKRGRSKNRRVDTKYER
ncbi:MAG: OmpA family protein [Sulfurospirillum sp.]|nr:OmpA family protein [Sulfurospirillum sp.]MBL0703790.1 OmpA family protein [Sulfurospirillum sp.]